jgi:hypothetical protein
LTLRATARAQDMLGASDDWAGTLDGLQYTLGEGPGVEAFTSGIPELVADLRAEEARWPGFCDAALAMDASAAFAFPRSCDCVAARSWPTGHCWRSPVTSSRRRSTPTN